MHIVYALVERKTFQELPHLLLIFPHSCHVDLAIGKKQPTGKDNYIDQHMLSEAHHTAEEMVYCFLSTRQPGKDIVARLFGPCKFVINWRTTNYNCFLSCKDTTHDEYKSSVVYEFSCPGCRSSYIGKTDRCLYTRIKKHSTRENSEIYAHVNSCEHFQHIKFLLELSPHLSNPVCTNTTQLIFNNCKVIDKSDHWSLLLFKESLAIRRRKPILNYGAKASKELIMFQ